MLYPYKHKKDSPLLKHFPTGDVCTTDINRQLIATSKRVSSQQGGIVEVITLGPNSLVCKSLTAKCRNFKTARHEFSVGCRAAYHNSVRYDNINSKLAPSKFLRDVVVRHLISRVNSGPLSQFRAIR